MQLTMMMYLRNSFTTFHKSIDSITIGEIYTPIYLYFSVLVVAIYILLSNSINLIFNSLIVDPFLKNIESSICNDITTITLVFLVLFPLLKVSIKYYYNVIRLLSMLMIIYLINRYNVSWEFVEFYYCNSIYYLDILPIVTIGFLVIVIRKDNSKQNKSNKEPRPFYQDSPLSLSDCSILKEQDSLNYYNYAKRISIKLIDKQFDKAFTVGITGSWGSGKTSFMNMIRCELDKHHTVVEFNPWLRPDSNSIISDFFDTLYNSLPYSHKLARKPFREYSNQLVNIKEYRKWDILNKTSNGYNLEDYYNDISILFEKLSMKVFIIIDDLDRLDPKEIITLFKLIRNTANFPNIVYITAYDQEYVINSIDKENIYNPRQYLKKIFQVEVNLPVINNHTLIEKFLSNIKTSISEYEYNNISKCFSISNKSYADDYAGFNVLKAHNNSLNLSFIDIFELFVRDIRDVNRISNSLLLNIEGLGNNIVLEDFFILELFRTTYPQIYDLFYIFRGGTLEINIYNNGRNYYHYKLNEDKETSLEVENKFIKHLKSTATENNLKIKDINNISYLLRFLFREKTGWDESKLNLSISSITRFEIYFRFQLVDSDFNLIEFIEYREQNNFYSALQRMIDVRQTNENVIDEIMKYFEAIINFEDLDDAYYIFRCVFYLYYQSHKESTISKSKKMYYSIDDIIDKLELFSNLAHDENHYFNLLIKEWDLYNEYDYPLMILLEILWNRKNEWRNILGDNTKNDLLIALTTKYTNQNDCDENYIIQILLHTISVCENNKNISSEEVYNLWINLFKKDICILFKVLTYKNFTTSEASNFRETVFSSLFNDFNDLKDKVDFNSLDSKDQEVINQLEEFYGQYIVTGHEIEYNFTNKCWDNTEQSILAKNKQ